MLVLQFMTISVASTIVIEFLSRFLFLKINNFLPAGLTFVCTAHFMRCVLSSLETTF